MYVCMSMSAPFCLPLPFLSLSFCAFSASVVAQLRRDWPRRAVLCAVVQCVSLCMCMCVCVCVFSQTSPLFPLQWTACQKPGALVTKTIVYRYGVKGTNVCTFSHTFSITPPFTPRTLFCTTSTPTRSPFAQFHLFGSVWQPNPKH